MKDGDTPQCCDEVKSGRGDITWRIVRDRWPSPDEDGWHLPGAPVPVRVRFCPFCGTLLPVVIDGKLCGISPLRAAMRAFLGDDQRNSQ
jgi:hypothetical protein